jgi:hypothetical protein
MSQQELEQAKKQIEDILEMVPQPDQLVAILKRDLGMNEIAELINDGKRGSIHAWKTGRRGTNWTNYIKLLYAAGYQIVKVEKE